MKVNKALAVILVMAFSVPTFAQVEEQRLFYARKADKFKRMKSIGSVLLVAGAVIGGVGLGKLENAPTTYNPNTGQTTYTTNEGALGALMFTGGLGMVGAGIPLTIIGTKKYRQYEEKLRSVTLNINPRPGQYQVALTFPIGR